MMLNFFMAILPIAIEIGIASGLILLLIRRYNARKSLTRRAGYESKQLISQRRATDYALLAGEMDKLFYSKAVYHPARWYTLPPNYRGIYVATDQYGLRIDRENVSDAAAKILFYGGSTMFSTTTRNEGAISNLVQQLLHPEMVNVLNYGMGGYSTYAEIGAFCEAIRRETNVRLAVFYDGVNETAMYLEMLQSGMRETFFRHAGWPYMAVTQAALRNFVRFQHTYHRTHKSLAARLCNNISVSSYIENLAERDIYEHAKQIVDDYVTNVRVIHAIGREFGISCLFIWQPDIFTTRKHLTTREKQIAESCPSILGAISRRVRNSVLNHPELQKLGLIDGTRWLDGLEGDHFFDYCHVSEEANEQIANEIAKVLRTKTSAAWWKYS